MAWEYGWGRGVPLTGRLATVPAWGMAPAPVLQWIQPACQWAMFLVSRSGLPQRRALLLRFQIVQGFWRLLVVLFHRVLP